MLFSALYCGTGIGLLRRKSLPESSGIFRLSVSNILGRKVMETAPSGNTGRGGLPSESTSKRNRSDTRRLVTQSIEVSRLEPTSAMVTTSRVREGRGISVVPEIELQPETEIRPEPERVIPAEIQLLSATCEECLIVHF